MSIKKKTAYNMFKSACFLLAVSLLISGCGKKEKEKPRQEEVPPAPVKTVEKVSEEKQNLITNPSFEESVDFEGIAKTIRKKPLGWLTRNQFLNDSNGWVSEEAHSGRRSLKIENIGGTNAYWKGESIVLDGKTNMLNISIWTKAKDIKDKIGNGEFQLAFDVYFENQKDKEVIAIAISPIEHDWEKISEKVLFEKGITKIVPYVVLSKMTGSVYFDDFFITAASMDLSKDKVLFDSNSKKSTFNISPQTSSDPEHLSPTIYEVKGSKNIISKDFIPVEENQVYKLSGEFKVVGTKPSMLYFGYAPFSENKKPLLPQYVRYIDDTETELIRPCKPTDKVIFVKNGKNWKDGKLYCIAFDIDSSGNYSDLPNTNLSSIGIDQIEKLDNGYSLKLKEACGKSYPAGTNIREHKIGGTYIYNAAAGKLLTPEENFDCFSNLITTDSSFAIPARLYPGTKYVKIIILANFQTPKATLQFKNIEMK